MLGLLPPFNPTEELVKITITFKGSFEADAENILEVYDTAEVAHEAWESLIEAVTKQYGGDRGYVEVENWRIPARNVEKLEVQQDGLNFTTPTRVEFGAWKRVQAWNGFRVRSDGYEYS